MNSQIICIGNRLLPDDASGPAVFDYLQKIDIPGEVDVIDGGTAGLNLLPLLEKGGRVVFVDTVSGFSDEGNIVILNQEDLQRSVTNPHYGHDIGLPYVLSVLPRVCDGKLPDEIVLIGLEGKCDTTVIDRAAQLSISIAVNGMRDQDG